MSAFTAVACLAAGACARSGGAAAEVTLPGAPPSPAIEASAASPPPPRKPKDHRPIAWMTSERDARDRAARARLPLVVWLRAAWSAACLEMERTTWRDPRVVEAMAPLVALGLDLSEGEGDAQRYAEAYGASMLPTIVVFDARGRKVASLHGFQGADAVLGALRSASEE